jgi:hypothetical protein
MSNSTRTIDTLARSLDRHLSEMGMGPRALVHLACKLIDRATYRVGQEDSGTGASD